MTRFQCSPRRMRAPQRCLHAAAALVTIALAPTIASASPRFELMVAGGSLVRLDSATGQAHVVPTNGDGGWRTLGGPADPGEAPARAGRFGLLVLGARSSGPIRRPDDPVRILRFDAATGRSWSIDLGREDEWLATGVKREALETTEPLAEPTRKLPRDTNSPGELAVIPRDALSDARTDPAEDVAGLSDALANPDVPSEIKVWAVRQMGEYEPELAMPPLLEAMRSDDPAVVAASIRALARSGAGSALPQILKLEDHPDPGVRAAVREVAQGLE